MTEIDALRIAAEQLAKELNKHTAGEYGGATSPEYVRLADAYRIVEALRYKLATQRHLW